MENVYIACAVVYRDLIQFNFEIIMCVCVVASYVERFVTYVQTYGFYLHAGKDDMVVEQRFIIR